jgi:hypothetical protein
MSEKNRHYLAALFGAVAFISLLSPARSPAPKPDDPSAFSLSGKFFGATASEDAAVIAALCDELARIIEADGKRDGGPRLKSGVQFDELRVAAREGRTRGVSIGARQPKARDAIEEYLNGAVGVSGGPVDAGQRAKWVDAFFVISGAASRAAGR